MTPGRETSTGERYLEEKEEGGRLNEKRCGHAHKLSSQNEGENCTRKGSSANLYPPDCRGELNNTKGNERC